MYEIISLAGQLVVGTTGLVPGGGAVTISDHVFSASGSEVIIDGTSTVIFPHVGPTAGLQLSEKRTPPKSTTSNSAMPASTASTVVSQTPIAGKPTQTAHKGSTVIVGVNRAIAVYIVAIGYLMYMIQ